MLTPSALLRFSIFCDKCPSSAQDPGIISHQHQLPDGSVLELLEMRPPATDAARAAQPPLLFLHGASHGAWCWAVSLSVMSLSVMPLLPLRVHCQACSVAVLITTAIKLPHSGSCSTLSCIGSGSLQSCLFATCHKANSGRADHLMCCRRISSHGLHSGDTLALLSAYGAMVKAATNASRALTSMPSPWRT